MNELLERVRDFCLIKRCLKIVKNDVWLLEVLVFVDELMDENAKDFKIMIRRFYKVCVRRKLRVNIAKSKVMVFSGKDETMCE